MLPDGFSELVKLVIEDWNWDTLPTTFDDIWDAFLYPIFLGDTVRSAQATYIKQILGDMLEFSAVQILPNDPKWSKKLLAIIDADLSSIKGTTGEGYKRGILLTTRKEVEELRVSRTIGDSLQFFQYNNIDVDTIKHLQNNESETSNLVASLSSNVFGVGYIKGVLWLYNCGIAKNIVPPNGHVKNFLRNCGYSDFKWSNDPDRYSDWQVFALANKCMKDVADKVSSDLGHKIYPKQAQFGAWYLQTCKGLLQRKGNKLTPQMLIEFLDWEKIDINQLGNKLDDVNVLDDLTDKFKTFLGYS